MDDSTSIDLDPQNWRKMQEFVKDIIQAFPIIGDLTRVGIVKFSNNATLVFPLNKYGTITQLLGAVDAIQQQGGLTNIAAALKLLRTDIFNYANGDRPNVKNVAIFITDGRATLNVNNINFEAHNNRDAGIELFAVGISDDINQDELETIASDPDDSHVFYADDFDKLKDILNDVIMKTCERVTTLPPPLSTTDIPYTPSKSYSVLL